MHKFFKNLEAASNFWVPEQWQEQSSIPRAQKYYIPLYTI
jgi:hypothetical protein